MTERLWLRIGALAGLLFVVLTIAVVFTSPTTPDADEPTAEIVRVLADEHGKAVTFAFILTLLAGVFLVFAAAVWSLLRRAEGGDGPSVLVLAGGIGTAIILLLTEVVFVAAAYSAENGREPEVIRTLFELSTPLYTSSSMPLAVFFGGVALVSIPRRALPRWIAWMAAALAAAFVVSLPSVFIDPEGGGAFGIFFFIGELGALVWILATSVVMLRLRSSAGDPV